MKMRKAKPKVMPAKAVKAVPAAKRTKRRYAVLVPILFNQPSL